MTAAIHSDKDEIHGLNCRDQLAEITRDEITNIFGLALSEPKTKVVIDFVLTRWQNVLPAIISRFDFFFYLSDFSSYIA